MASRDRTSLFIQYRNSLGKSASFSALGTAGSSSLAKSTAIGGARGGNVYSRLSNGDENGTDDESMNERLLSKNGRSPQSNTKSVPSGDGSKDVAIDMTSLPPKWIDVVEEIQDDIQKLRDKISKVEGMHKKNLLPGFDETEKERAMIESLTGQILSSFSAIQTRIKSLGGGDSRTFKSSEEQSMIKNAMTMLALNLQEMSSKFRQSQSNYLNNINGRSSAVTNDIFAPTLLDQAMPNNFSMGFTQQQLLQVHSNEASIDKRTKEITELSKSIHHLAEVFRDLQTMIVDQGTLLDRIDYNIEDMSHNVKSAHQELTQARDLQKKSKESYILFILVVLVVVLFIALLIKRSGR